MSSRERLVRVAFAFAASPAASALTMVVILSGIGGSMPSASYVVTVGTLAYGAAIIVGIPAFLLSRGWRLHSLTFYVSAAVVVSMPVVVVAAMLTGGAQLPVVTGLSAVSGGVVFFAIVEGLPCNGKQRGEVARDPA